MKWYPVFFRAVGVEYVIMGIFSVIPLLNFFALLVALLGLVAPLQVLEVFRQGGGSGAFSLIPQVFAYSGAPIWQTVSQTKLSFFLAGLAIIGGVCAWVGAVKIEKRRVSGYILWGILTAIAILTAVWNYTYVSSNPGIFHSYTADIIVNNISIFWAALYLIAYIFALKDYKKYKTP